MYQAHGNQSISGQKAKKRSHKDEIDRMHYVPEYLMSGVRQFCRDRT